MSDAWYYADKNGKVGPLALEKLREKFTSLTSEQMSGIFVWHQGLPDWKPAKDVAELYSGPLPPPLPIAWTTKATLIPANQQSKKAETKPHELRGNQRPGISEATSADVAMDPSVQTEPVPPLSVNQMAALIKAGGIILAAIFAIIIILVIIVGGIEKKAVVGNQYNTNESGTRATDRLKDAIAAHGRGEYATALRLYQPLAEQGVARAQNALGLMYDKGQGVPQDYAEALKWYLKAADQGYASAEFNIAGMYQLGHGVPQDYAKAIEWLRKAADQGDANAQLNLGQMYVLGLGVPTDFVIAYKWINLSVAQDNQEAVKYRQNLMKIMIQELPRFDVEAHCRKIAMAFSNNEFSPSLFGGCKTVEQVAYDELTGKYGYTGIQWDKAPTAFRQYCLEQELVGFSPSYQGLLGCISSSIEGNKPFRR